MAKRLGFTGRASDGPTYLPEPTRAALKDLGVWMRECGRCGSPVGTNRRRGPRPICGPCVLAEQEEAARIDAEIGQAERDAIARDAAIEEERERREMERDGTPLRDHEAYCRAENLPYRLRVGDRVRHQDGRTGTVTAHPQPLGSPYVYVQWDREPETAVAVEKVRRLSNGA